MTRTKLAVVVSSVAVAALIGTTIGLTVSGGSGNTVEGCVSATMAEINAGIADGSIFRSDTPNLPIPSACNGLSDADKKEAASRVMSQALPEVFVGAFANAFGK